ncbi:MAG: stage V sporulation protein S [Thermotogota bacterium]|nr:stage V sporulation protein S [Thermotogota bacterium]
MEVLKVSSKSNPNKVAGAIAGVLSKSNQVELQAIGAGAVNQAVKAVAIASRFLDERCTSISMVPGFVEIAIGEEMRTGISFKVAADKKEQRESEKTEAPKEAQVTEQETEEDLD